MVQVIEPEPFVQLTEGASGACARTGIDDATRLCGLVEAGPDRMAFGSCADTPGGSSSVETTGSDGPDPLLFTVIGNATGSPPGTNWIGSAGPEAFSTGVAAGGAGVGGAGAGAGCGAGGWGAGG
ncbi:hypothetical protein [Saccharopolyspora elongata]|uniref:hypothetical protein n=1 Tax=Saccharopolyspora elongata TaxID=2530387 RepID=UPI001F408E38|nr:hypothetical protein [Saccharopolyspora elongata]